MVKNSEVFSEADDNFNTVKNRRPEGLNYFS